MNFLLRFFLFFSFFLSVGHGRLEAHSHLDDNHHTSIKDLESAPRIDHCRIKAPVVTASPSRKEKQPGEIEITKNENREEDENEEDEEDKLTSSKKNVNSGNYFITFFCNQLSGYFSGYNQQYFPFPNDFSYTSSHRLIFFHVFRI